jgi:hypothetical protein
MGREAVVILVGHHTELLGELLAQPLHSELATDLLFHHKPKSTPFEARQARRTRRRLGVQLGNRVAYRELHHGPPHRVAQPGSADGTTRLRRPRLRLVKLTLILSISPTFLLILFRDRIPQGGGGQ